jgi:hypothetical protein
MRRISFSLGVSSFDLESYRNDSMEILIRDPPIHNWITDFIELLASDLLIRHSR